MGDEKSSFIERYRGKLAGRVVREVTRKLLTGRKN
jgi:hypothetical protein